MSDSSAPVRDASLKITHVLAVDAAKLGTLITHQEKDGDIGGDWDFDLDDTNIGVQHLRVAAEQLRTSNVPVAFPTETVYGLGADATRSEAVKGIYTAKQRPSDNPLIVHFASVRQLKDLLSTKGQVGSDVIPPIYLPLIRQFWPGPLTIILPNPPGSPLASEVTAGLSTFGARIPRNILALLLIKLAGKPIAAPSANASTKPSPTAAEHVKEDLDGRIEYILDGGPCDVGVESTVVDGLSSPPAILRPGGISIEQIRACPGWQSVVVGYEDASMKNGAPRAPGMKYRHYSPRARVFLYEAGSGMPTMESALQQGVTTIGVVGTRNWNLQNSPAVNGHATTNGHSDDECGSSIQRAFQSATQVERPAVRRSVEHVGESSITRWDVQLGCSTGEVARNLFWALRELDREGCDVIFVEGIDGEEGDVAAAVMNRLRKAAKLQISSQPS